MLFQANGSERGDSSISGGDNREEYLMQCQLFLSSSSEKNVLLYGTLHEVAAVKFVLSSRIRLAALGGTFFCCRRRLLCGLHRTKVSASAHSSCILRNC